MNIKDEIQDLEKLIDPGKATFFLENNSFKFLRKIVKLQQQGYIFVHRKEYEVFFTKDALPFLSNAEFFKLTFNFE